MLLVLKILDAMVTDTVRRTGRVKTKICFNFSNWSRVRQVLNFVNKTAEGEWELYVSSNKETNTQDDRYFIFKTVIG